MKVYGDVNIQGNFWPQIAIQISEVDFTEDTDSGRLIYNAEDNCLYYGDKGSWVKITDSNDLLNTGQRLIFCNTTLPTGFTAVSLDDEMILITNSLSSIGTESGSWTISATDYNANHDHFSQSGMGIPSVTGNRGTSEIYATAAGSTHKHTLSSSGRHQHTFENTWRPDYLKYMIGEYEG